MPVDDLLFHVRTTQKLINIIKLYYNSTPYTRFGIHIRRVAKRYRAISTISASVAAQHLAPGGFIALTGAKAALEGTPSMIGYGMAKAAVHQLTRSLGTEGSGLPADSLAVAIMPVTLDTPMNRKWMPKADFSTWTPLSYVAEMFMKWSKGQDRPKSGSLLALVTKNNETQLVVE